LPDATILSAGGGEFDIGNHTPNRVEDTHRNAQIYRPPYLFRGTRPEIIAAPTEVAYGATFTVSTAAPNEIGKVTWVRLPSVTHTDNMNQRISFLDFEATANGLRVSAPTRPERCPPGHYMLFVLNRAGVPSVASMVHIAVPPGMPATSPRAGFAPRAAPSKPAATLEDLDRAIRETASGTQAVIGLTSKCPYGLGACWGGAYEALVRLEGVHAVRPVANAEDSTADVYLGRDTLPNIDRWAEQIAQTANGSYDLRGVEVSITGVPVRQAGGLALMGPLFAAPLPLHPLGDTDKVQFDLATRRARPATSEEKAAFDQLAKRVGAASDATPVRVTGPLVRAGDGWVLHVRAFHEVSR
jgi:galactose oxidase